MILEWFSSLNESLIPWCQCRGVSRHRRLTWVQVGAWHRGGVHVQVQVCLCMDAGSAHAWQCWGHMGSVLCHTALGRHSVPDLQDSHLLCSLNTGKKRILQAKWCLFQLPWWETAGLSRYFGDSPPSPVPCAHARASARPPWRKLLHQPSAPGQGDLQG